MYLMQTIGTEWQNLEQIFRETTARVIGSSIHSTADTADSRYMHIFIVCCYPNEERNQSLLILLSSSSLGKKQPRLCFCSQHKSGHVLKNLK